MDSSVSKHDEANLPLTILELLEDGDYEGILSLSGLKIVRASNIAAMRQAYHKLSLRVHPDKMGPDVPDASKAFQALVSAFERMSQPDLYVEEEGEEDGKEFNSKPLRISRSNDGCYRTVVKCPCCKEPWGSGFAKNEYNIFMQGLKMYECAVCAFDFGCMSALHECPHCRGPFYYHPGNFHSKITCLNAGCAQEFGFYEFPMSDSRQNQIRKHAKLDNAARAAQQAAYRKNKPLFKKNRFLANDERTIGFNCRQAKNATDNGRTLPVPTASAPKAGKRSISTMNGERRSCAALRKKIVTDKIKHREDILRYNSRLADKLLWEKQVANKKAAEFGDYYQQTLALSANEGKEVSSALTLNYTASEELNVGKSTETNPETPLEPLSGVDFLCESLQALPNGESPADSTFHDEARIDALVADISSLSMTSTGEIKSSIVPAFTTDQPLVGGPPSTFAESSPSLTYEPKPKLTRKEREQLARQQKVCTMMYLYFFLLILL
jgi:hypothetical protein